MIHHCEALIGGPLTLGPLHSDSSEPALWTNQAHGLNKLYAMPTLDALVV
jgi:hypothetical protein